MRRIPFLYHTAIRTVPSCLSLSPCSIHSPMFAKIYNGVGCVSLSLAVNVRRVQTIKHWKFIGAAILMYSRQQYYLAMTKVNTIKQMIHCTCFRLMRCKNTSLKRSRQVTRQARDISGLNRLWHLSWLGLRLTSSPLDRVTDTLRSKSGRQILGANPPKTKQGWRRTRAAILTDDAADLCGT